MKKSEVPTASTEDLIMELVNMVTSSSIMRSHQRTASWICNELASRKVIDDAESLYARWDHQYTW